MKSVVFFANPRSDSTSFLRSTSLPQAFSKNSARSDGSHSNADSTMSAMRSLFLLGLTNFAVKGGYKVRRRNAGQRSLNLDKNCSGGIFAQRAAEPELGKIPIAQNGLRRNVQHFCDFIGFEAAEKLQLHNVAFTGVGAGETLQCVV